MGTETAPKQGKRMRHSMAASGANRREVNQPTRYASRFDRTTVGGRGTPEQGVNRALGHYGKKPPPVDPLSTMLGEGPPFEDGKKATPAGSIRRLP
jgi:hypothetical protein